MNRLTLTLACGSTGRQWDADALELLLDCIADMGLGAACALPGMPKRRTVLAWARSSPDWRAALEAAQEDYARLLVDEALQRADSAEDRESAACARIQSDVRLKAAALLAPNVYGRERGGLDQGGVVVTLLRLAAQGIQDRRALEAVPLKPLTDQDMYTAERQRVNNGLTNAPSRLAGADPGVYANSSRETGAGGAPATGEPPLSPPPTNTPGPNPGTLYTEPEPGMTAQQIARDRIVVTIPDELDVLSGVQEAMDEQAALDALALDEPLPA